mmetsp:Transcript_26277/g.71055  ORF Transcript_26277/g.71055 Transcript_26277/m.71055 type:complete len:271 (+) Transcript_26277:767-1579(+)
MPSASVDPLPLLPAPSAPVDPSPWAPTPSDPPFSGPASPPPTTARLPLLGGREGSPLVTGIVCSPLPWIPLVVLLAVEMGFAGGPGSLRISCAWARSSCVVASAEAYASFMACRLCVPPLAPVPLKPDLLPARSWAMEDDSAGSFARAEPRFLACGMYTCILWCGLVCVALRAAMSSASAASSKVTLPGECCDCLGACKGTVLGGATNRGFCATGLLLLALGLRGDAPLSVPAGIPSPAPPAPLPPVLEAAVAGATGASVGGAGLAAMTP